MSYIQFKEFAVKMVGVGESKIFMATKDALIRAYMAGAILALAAGFSVAIAVNTGNFLVASLLFPVGFCTLYLLGFDLADRCLYTCPACGACQADGLHLKGSFP
jgi:formate/nitrite transporter FocA (FNT family)